MINGRDNIIIHLSEVQPRWWRLFDGSYAKNKFKMAAYEEKDGTVEQSMEYLESILERCGPGIYTLHYTDSVATNKGPSWTAPMQVPFKISRTDNLPAIGSQQGMPVHKAGYSDQDVQRMIREGIEQEKRLWDLERQLEDTQASLAAKETPWERAIANPQVQGFLSELAGKVMGMNRVPARPSAVGYIGRDTGAEEEVPTDENEKQLVEVEVTESTNVRLAEVFNRLLPLFNYDQEKVMEALESLTDKVEQNPGLIAML